ncbi:hypothetical protein SAMN02910370_02807 [Lachnospiraceae bacterium XPB1003]|nr:hypothetical protein SAMN02910370_02807 [Lachnospiraceae bacterium XPB1003]
MRTTLDSLRIILSLKNTVNINSILHGLRSLPIIGKYISEKIYSIRFIKIIAFIISIQKEILKAFLGKLGIVLFLALVSVPVSTFTNHTAATTFLYGFVYFSLIFAFFHNIFGSTVEGNYAVLMMGMDPKKYVLARLLYKTASILIGYTLFSIPAAIIVKVPWYIALLLPLSAVGYMVGRLGLQMLYFSARQSGEKTVSIEGNTAIITILVLIIIFGGAAVSPWVIYYDMLIVCEIAVAIGVIAAPVGLFLIRKFPYGLYRTALYAEHTKTEISKDKCKKANRGYKEYKISEIKTNDKVESRSKGFKYLNDLFIKRHGSVLYGRMMMTIAIGAVLITLASIFLHYEIKESELPSQSTLRFLFSRHPGIFLFMLFVINSGAHMAQAMFSNCDSAMLMYGFYKDPGAIRKMYNIRCLSAIRLNILPALMMAVFAVITLALTGGEDYAGQYSFTVLEIITAVAFFSIRHMTLYYILQPYTSDFLLKSYVYAFITFISGTFFFILIFVPINAKWLTLIGFAILISYYLASNLIIYRFGPKTFRIK